MSLESTTQAALIVVESSQTAVALTPEGVTVATLVEGDQTVVTVAADEAAAIALVGTAQTAIAFTPEGAAAVALIRAVDETPALAVALRALPGDVTVGTTPGTVAAGDDPRFSDTREWTASTVPEAEAQAGTATTRRAWTAQRVFQAIAAWWAASAAATKLAGIATGATANATNAELRDRATHTGTQGAGTITGLATVATSGAYGDLSGRPSLGTAAATAAADYATAAQGVKADAAFQVVNHGSTAGTARPAGAPAVYWIGTVEPTNALDGDLWIGGA